MTYQDWTYYGTQSGEDDDEDREWEPACLYVEEPRPGPTERKHPTLLRILPEPDDGGFGWGYNGSGTSRAAATILADALELGPESAISVSSYPEDKVLIQLREDFCHEVLSQFGDQWRLRRAVVLRWARAWYLQAGVDDIPTALKEPPPSIDLDF